MIVNSILSIIQLLSLVPAFVNNNPIKPLDLKPGSHAVRLPSQL